MRSSVLASAVLVGISLAQSSTSGAALDNDLETVYVTVHPDACVAQHPGPEFVLPTVVTAVPSEDSLSTTTITTTSTHVVWVTEDKKNGGAASETSLTAAPMAYAPFTPPIAPLSCDDAPTLTYISETVFETLPATTVTTTSVSTTTEVVDHSIYSTSYVYVTPSQTPITVTSTSTATVTANPSLSTVTVTDRVTDIHNVTVTASQERISVTITETESGGVTRSMNTLLTSGLFKGTSTTLNVVPVVPSTVISTLSKPVPTPSALHPTMPTSSSTVSNPISSSLPVISTLMTTSSPLAFSKPAFSTMQTSHPVSSLNNASAPIHSHLSTGYSTPVTLKTATKTSSPATAPTVSPTPCLTTKNVTLNFDNLPINRYGKESPKIPSPYEHFYFSKGWVYGRSASVTHKQFPASSGNSMAAYLPSLSSNASAPGSFGILPNDTEIAHGFKMRSLRFGCNGLNAPKNEICRVLITGIPLEQGAKKHALEVDIEPCTFSNGCALAIVNFGENMFPALEAMQFKASIGNQTVGWFIDDIDMGVEVGCDSTQHGTMPVHRATQTGNLRKRSISYEPFIEPAKKLGK